MIFLHVLRMRRNVNKNVFNDLNNLSAIDFLKLLQIAQKRLNIYIYYIYI